MHKSTLINIGQLIQVRSGKQVLTGSEMNRLPILNNAYITIENQVITAFGEMKDLPETKTGKIIDIKGKLVMPAWIDSHTHLVFAASRAGEFVDKIKGLSYEEIAARGGGILNSAKMMNDIDEEQLYLKSKELLDEIIRYGTGAVEIKSGYGLSIEGELKMLRVIKRLKETTHIPVKATFLGAHALPEAYKNDKNGYIDLIINKMLPVIYKEQLADYIDVFCEKGYFSAAETNRILQAGLHYGLKPKLHINQFNSIGGIKTAIKNKAISVDHLEVMTPDDFDLLSASSTIATALPGCSFFIDIPYAPVKEMIEKNIAVALATDFNPGSTPSFNMNFMVSLACIKQKLTPEQAINAATVNAAAALELQNEMGSIAIGKKANLSVLKPFIKDYKEIPYYFGINPVIERIIE
jgi:imidazolonepropionase